MYLSPEFAGAFIVLFAVYWLIQKSPRWSNLLLLAFSWAFYASFGTRMLLYLGVFTAAVYLLAQAICRSRQSFAKPLLVIGIGALVANLASIKYYLPLVNFAASLVPQGPAWVQGLLTLDVFVPVGISFISFQAISLLVECYRDASCYRRITPGEVALYLAFFPTVVAGPICRPHILLPQLKLARRLAEPSLGITLIMQGLFKKLVIAHWLAAVWVDPMFDNPEAFNGLELMLGAAAYSIQIYADFSGLTDIVRGMAWLLGFHLPENFQRPYLAHSPREFWQRWHISLSTWIRDFIYIPLGGNRRGLLRSQLNLLIAMLASGLWHGAGWNYLAWGGIHGLGCICARGWKFAPPRPLQIALTFAFTSLAWIFFRAPDLEQALSYLRAMASFEQAFTYNLLGGSTLLLVFFAFHALGEKSPKWFFSLLSGIPTILRYPAVTLFAWLCIELGPSGIPDFIYSRY